MTDWQFWVDVGGTFTDCVARSPQGELRALKVLSSGLVQTELVEDLGSNWFRASSLAGYPDEFFTGYALVVGEGVVGLGKVASTRIVGFDARRVALRLAHGSKGSFVPPCRIQLDGGEPAPILAIRRALGLGLAEEIGPVDVRLGTTLGTNALLERRGARTALVITAGLRDLLRIGYQNRPDLFDLRIRRPALLYEQVVEARERMSAEGEVVEALDQDDMIRSLTELRRSGIEALAVCLLNSYRNSDHEERIAQVARELDFLQVSVSSSLSPTQKIVPRGDTTLVDAYLTPVVRTFLDGVAASLPGSSLRLMTSAGSLVRCETFSGRDTILSGPAGGVVALSEVAERAGIDRAIGFDMGGTSTDVSRFSGEFTYEHETEKAGVRIVAPMLAVETVAAGGGSICDFDGQKLVVGPRSAGATPGPACYGHGGPLAVTDMNLFLGRLEGAHFPFALDRDVVEQELEKVGARLGEAKRAIAKLESAELASGFIHIANSAMAAAIRRISVAKGYDLRRYVLVCFGGAGGQHACAVAAELGMNRVLIHPYAGVLSAYGMGIAEVAKFGVRTVLRRWTEELPAKLDEIFAELEGELRPLVEAEGVAASRIAKPRRSLELRYEGQSSEIEIDIEAGAEGRVPELFENEHRGLYGHVFEGRAIEVVAARVKVTGSMQKVPISRETERGTERSPTKSVRAYFDGEWLDAGVFERSDLVAGDHFEGPALVVEETATTVVEPNWRCRRTETGDLLLEKTDDAPRTKPSSLQADPVGLELFNRRFAAIAEQMGTILQRTSLSVNVKERLDFSCAVFTGDGRLVANAPHMPVHLGAMSETVKCLLEDVGSLGPGDVLLTNDPFRGGSHLPDITVVTPVFGSAGKQPLFFTASRAHHADIGGLHPGSMPPDSRNLEEEGVLLKARKVVEGGETRFEELRRSLEGGRYPARSIDENLADVSAQIAANQSGAVALKRLMSVEGVAHTLAYMEHIQSAAEGRMRSALGRFEDGDYRFEDKLDDGSRIRLLLRVRGERAVLDFAGTSPPVESNLNANLAIVKAAVIYCFRCLIDEEIPLNEGVLTPLELHVPICLLNPRPGPDAASSPAVVGGNVETSQRITDVILGALGLAAASQGTMNNLTFGSDRFGYYETICGGAGAGPGWNGADAVHTHMTNTRLTDAEVLEARFPVRLRRFEVRDGSGGAGEFRGGDGVVREIEFLQPMHVAILSQRRTTQPYGLAGGAPGAAGRNRLVSAAGETRDLGSVATMDIGPGDRIIIETPGGGGYGESRASSPFPS